MNLKYLFNMTWPKGLFTLQLYCPHPVDCTVHSRVDCTVHYLWRGRICVLFGEKSGHGIEMFRVLTDAFERTKVPALEKVVQLMRGEFHDILQFHGDNCGHKRFRKDGFLDLSLPLEHCQSLEEYVRSTRTSPFFSLCVRSTHFPFCARSIPCVMHAHGGTRVLTWVFWCIF